MSWFDEEIKDHLVKTKVESFKKSQKALTKEQIAEIIPEFKKHYKEQLKKEDVGQRDLYKDAFGGFIIVVKTKNEKDYKMLTDSRGYNYFWANIPLFREDTMIFFSGLAPLTKNGDEIIKGNQAIVLRGWAMSGVRDIEDKDKKINHMDEVVYLKKKGVDTLKELSYPDYDRRVNFTVWKVLSVSNIG